MNASWIKFIPTFINEWLDGRKQLKKAIGNTSWLFADKIIRTGIGFFLSIWVARYLGPGDYGLLSYALAFVTLFTPFISLGLDDIVLRDLAIDPSTKDETIGTAFFLKLCGCLVSFAVALGTIFLLRRSDNQIHLLVGIIAAGSIFHVFAVIEFWFNAQVQSKYVVLARCAAFIVCSAIRIILIINGAELAAFAWVCSIEIVLGSVGLIVYYQSKSGSLKTWLWTLRRTKSLLKDSWPLALSSIAWVFYLRIDQVMLGEMVGSEEVGIYSVAVRLSETWSFIPLAFFSSFFPTIIRAKSISDDQFYEKSQKFYNLVALSAYTIAVPVSVLAKWLVGFLYDDAFSSAAPMLTILIWANVFTFLEIARGSYLLAMNWTKVYFASILLGAIINILLNLFLIPKYGGFGAAVASLIAYWFAVHGICFLYKPLRRTGVMMTKSMLYPKIW